MEEPESKKHVDPTQADYEPEVTEQVRKILGCLGARAVFGKPVKQGDVTVIPVAEVHLGFGFGKGPGPRPGRSGGGGGGGGAKPRGYLTIRDGAVTYRPIVDVTRLGMVGLAVGALLALVLFRLDRS